jgi:CubicO group peptidase (beta-lactamase class C family)
MNPLSEKLTQIIKYNLPKLYTGISYAIMVKGELVAAGTAGNSGGKEKKPLQLTDTFNVASVSKIFCSLAVMKLVEQGKVSLDTPVVEYLPQFEMPDPRYRLITLRHCLSHTSGLPGTQWKGFSVTDTAGSDYYAEVYDYFSVQYMKATPGEYAVYCNDGFTLAEMVVAEISQMSFSSFCSQYIMDPLDMPTTRLSDQLNGEINVVREKEKPAELLLIQGAAGFTTSMVDLCKLGQMVLHPEPHFQQLSLQEMAKPHGRTFLTDDDRTPSYGLGWDNVSFKDPEYDLGDDVLLKGGNSFQFTTQFLVIPKYEAVLAISETHDCKLDVNETILRLFATAMLEQGINLYTKQQVIPEKIKTRFGGRYLMPSGVLHVHFYGTTCQINRETSRGESYAIHKNLKYNGKEWISTEDLSLFFTEHEQQIYLISNLKGRRIPQAQKAKNYPNYNDAWRARLEKQFIVIDTNPYDLVIREIMTGFFVKALPEHQGILLASFSGRSDGDVYGVFEAPFLALTDDVGKGFLNTPANPSRDMISPHFFSKEGVEYCKVSSYLYRNVEGLPVYQGQTFHQGKINRVYRIQEELKTLPEIPNGRRLLIMNKDMTVLYDSLLPEPYLPAKEGFISFI